MTGEDLATRFAALADRLGWDLHLRVGDTDLTRCADVVALDPTWPVFYLDDPRWGPVLSRPTGLLDPGVLNSRRWRQTSFAAIGLHASARSLALFYDDLLRPDGAVAALLGAELHAQYVGAQATGVDLVLGREVAWTLGFQLDPGEIGMGGAGGCAAWGSTPAATPRRTSRGVSVATTAATRSPTCWTVAEDRRLVREPRHPAACLSMRSRSRTQKWWCSSSSPSTVPRHCRTDRPRA